MGTKLSGSVAAAADAFEAKLKSCGVPHQLYDGLWDLWADRPERADALCRLFSGATTKAADVVQVRYKAGGDAIDQLGQQFLALLREAGDDEAKSWLEGAIAEMQSGASTDTSAGQVINTSKRADAGPMSAQKEQRYDPRTDPIARALHADQLRGKR